MNTDHIPYSREALEALARSLDVHSELLWVEPNSQRVGIKELRPVVTKIDAVTQEV